MSCGVGLDPELLWLWCRPVAVALIPSLGTSICLRCGPKKQKKGRKEGGKEGRRERRKERNYKELKITTHHVQLG